MVSLRYIWCGNTRYSVFLYFHIAVRFLFSRITYKTKARSASAVPTGAAPPLLLAVGEPPETPFSKSNKSRRGNINLLSIGYAFRPCLRNRLTLGGLPFPRKPQVFGERDLHPLSRYSYRHSHLIGPPPLLTVWPVSPYQRSSTTCTPRRTHKSAASVSCIS